MRGASDAQSAASGAEGSAPPGARSSGEALTHLDEAGRARMVDVGDKPTSRRRAVARATVAMSPATAQLLAEGDLPKGDALAVARVAGIMAAKQTPQLVPLCHPVALASVTVDLEVEAAAGTVRIVAEAATTDRTGVEMEALTAVTVAGLTVYDMVKGVERGVRITEVALVAKEGGASGSWHEEERP